MISFFRKLITRNSHAITFSDLVQRFISSREAAGLRDYTLRNYDIFGRRVVRTMGESRVDCFTQEDFAALKTTHSVTFAEDMQVMLRWAAREGLLKQDVSRGQLVDRVRKDAMPPRHFTPGEAQRFYAAVSDSYKAAFALALYAGLRPLEVCRIDWSAINVKERRIRIDPEVSKIRRARMIEGVPTILWAQLSLYEQRRGPLIERCSISAKYGDANSWLWTKERRRAAKTACVALSPDILRHSFATYFVAYTGSTDKAAKILGHHDLLTLATHYDGVATKADAEDYFHPKPILALPQGASINP